MNNRGTAPKPVWACAIVPCRNSNERPDDSRFVSWKPRPSSGTGCENVAGSNSRNPSGGRLLHHRAK